MNPVTDFYLKTKDPFGVYAETDRVLNGGQNPVPLLYNNEGQYNPAPRINQPSPVQQQTKENPIKRFFNSLRTPEGYVRPGGQGLSENNPFASYYRSKWLKPTTATQVRAQEWENQNAARQAKTADNFQIDQQFIDALADNDPIKPYLRPGMNISTDTLYRLGALNQKQAALDADEITDDERQQMADRYNREINIYNPDGSINPDKYNYRQAVISAIYDYTSKKGLQNALAKLNTLQVPKAIPVVKQDNIRADTANTNARTETEKKRPAYIEAQTANTNAGARDKNASAAKKLADSAGFGDGWSKSDKDFMARIDKDYSQYTSQMKATYKQALIKPKDEWLKQQYPEKHKRYHLLQHGNVTSPAKNSTYAEADKLVKQHKGTARALKQLWGTNVKEEVVQELLDRYNRVNKTKYTLTQFRDKFIK